MITHMCIYALLLLNGMLYYPEDFTNDWGIPLDFKQTIAMSGLLITPIFFAIALISGLLIGIPISDLNTYTLNQTSYLVLMLIIINTGFAIVSRFKLKKEKNENGWILKGFNVIVMFINPVYILLILHIYFF